MGAGGSTNQYPAPRVASREPLPAVGERMPTQGATGGTGQVHGVAGRMDPAQSAIGRMEETQSTVRTMDLPPVITHNARSGMMAGVGLRRHYVFGTLKGLDLTAYDKTLEQIRELTQVARRLSNIRDYVTLLIEDAVLKLCLDKGPPSEELLDLARFVNPFLTSPAGLGAPDMPGPSSKEPETTESPIPPFRATDGAYLAGPEKDLLVLLYYCHYSNIKASPDEVVGHLCKMAEKYGTIQELDRRAEPLTETEVYIHWAIFYLTKNITGDIEAALAKASMDKLNLERGTQLSRMMTVCEMLASDGRLDQACFCLMFLRHCTANAASDWWKKRAKRLAKEIAKKRPGREDWHKDFAEQTMKSAIKLPDGQGAEIWAHRNSLMISRDDLVGGLPVLKGV